MSETATVNDVNALLGRYQNELAKTATRAIVAEALNAEARQALAARTVEVEALRARVAELEAASADVKADGGPDCVDCGDAGQD